MNVDCDARPNVDVVADVAVLPFGDDSVEAIYASHILEHFPHPRTPIVLTEWKRVLKPRGLLQVSVPDFERCVELYKETGMSEWLRNFVSGDQGYATAFHYNIFDEHSLSSLLKVAGFKDVSRVDRLINGVNDCSAIVSTYDMLPVSLNMVAVK